MQQLFIETYCPFPSWISTAFCGSAFPINSRKHSEWPFVAVKWNLNISIITYNDKIENVHLRAHLPEFNFGIVSLNLICKNENYRYKEGFYGLWLLKLNKYEFLTVKHDRQTAHPAPIPYHLPLKECSFYLAVWQCGQEECPASSKGMVSWLDQVNHNNPILLWQRSVLRWAAQGPGLTTEMLISLEAAGKHFYLW